MIGYKKGIIALDIFLIRNHGELVHL